MGKTKLLLVLMLLLGSAAASAGGFDARVEWARRVAMSVPVSGVVEMVAIETGQSVQKGQVLVQLEQTPFETELAAARSARIQAAGDRREAQRDHAQTKELYERGLISNVELENAELKAKGAVAAWNAAAARVKRAEYDLAHSSLRAPFDGWLLQRKVQVGESIISTQQAQTLIVVAAANEYLARAAVPAKKMNKLKLGDPAMVEVGKEVFKGTVAVMGLEPIRRKNADDLFYEIAVSFNSGGKLLRAGQEAEVDF